MAGKCGIDPAFVIRALQKRMSHLVPEVINAAPRILTSRPSSRPRVCVLGAGPTGLYSAQKLIPHCDVTVIDSKDYFEFTPSVLRVEETFETKFSVLSEMPRKLLYIDHKN